MKLRNVFWFTLLSAAAMAAQAQDRHVQSTHRSPYTQWKRGLPISDTAFPIAVWLQDPSKAAAYKAAGINLYVGLWQGPTREQLAQLKAAGMPVIVEQTPRSLAFVDDRTIVGWMHGDEPDNAQEVVDPATGKKGYGPCIPPSKIVAEYEKMRAADPTRPIMLNLGQGVANDKWVGRGSGAKIDDYSTYVLGADIASFDVYPIADGLEPIDGSSLGYVSKGLDRLTRWAGRSRPVWNCIECTRISGGGKATPAQVRAETWLALIHGSRGIIYFVHQFKPSFDEHALLDDPEMLASVTKTNLLIQELAPVLNGPTLLGRAEAAPVSEQPAIDMMAKQSGGSLYLFAVQAREGRGRQAFTVRGVPAKAMVEVVGESRTIAVEGGRFQDNFGPYDVHIYRVHSPGRSQ